MLYGIGRLVLSFSQLRFDDFGPVCVYWRISVLLVASDDGGKGSKASLN